MKASEMAAQFCKQIELGNNIPDADLASFIGTLGGNPYIYGMTPEGRLFYVQLLVIRRMAAIGEGF